MSVFLNWCDISQVSVADATDMCSAARPAVDISYSLSRGLEMLEVGLNAKKLKRLNAKVRNSTALSCAF